MGEGKWPGVRLKPCHVLQRHYHKWSSLIAGLDCGLDRWTGLLDWITGLTFELKLCVSHDLHPIRCAELGHMFDA